MWTTTNTIVSATLYPLYKICLALLLLPNEYSFIAIVSIYFSIGYILANAGIGDTVLRFKNIEDDEKTLIFYINLAFSSVSTAFIFATAESVVVIFSLPQNFIFDIRLCSAVIFLLGISSFMRALIQKHSYFKFYSTVNIVKVIIDILLSLILIYGGMGVRGFIFGSLLSLVLLVVLYAHFIYSNKLFTFKLKVEFRKLKRFIDFSVFVSVKQFITALGQKADEIVLLKILGSESLGTYSLGKEIALRPQQLITQTCNHVIFSNASRVQNDLETLRNFFMDSSKILSLIAIPIFSLLAFNVDALVHVLFKPEWYRTADTIKIISLGAIILSLTAGLVTSILYVLDQHKKVVAVDIFTVVTLLLIYTYLPDEIEYFIIACIFLLMTSVKSCFLLIMCLKNLNASVYEYCATISRNVFASLAMCLFGFIIRDILGFENLVILIISMTLFYCFAIFKLDRDLVKLLIGQVMSGKKV